jgi:hypothetical protein
MTTAGKSQARVDAGRRNRQLRGPLSAEGRERLRQAALANRPWEKSTGPTTPAGKAVVAANGRARQKGLMSVREQRAATAEVSALLASMASLRRAARSSAHSDK